ncbi:MULTISPECIES: tyrosine-type recombinase/integrase [unclassified Streptomyces]|uniref:tyrosine-type recombinase/integrase n=1 Tax=unclassified Streptomyces TaxID=2593676 RepID=UPI000749BC4C|nr:MULTISPECIES: tyrosine-type recombinase/integrase [unclassified Streptomyces]KUL69412.1 integrase [Streptomyces sp. NRRL WC-3604]KUL70030.1 integrase [Streptomyces sp. NRRL WC-3605]
MTATGNVVPLHQPRLPAGQTADGAAPKVLAEWTRWLRERVDPAWRPAEWDGDAHLFSGDVDNPGTAVYRCDVAACDALTRVRRGLCATCEKTHRGGNLGLKEFKALYVPDRNRVISGERAGCRIQGCPRDSVLWGLCNAHGSLRQKDLQRDPGSQLGAWIVKQSPYPPSPACRVAGCRYDARATWGLCAMHQSRWKKVMATVRGSRPEPSAVWLDRQAPFLNVHQFSLAPLAPVARLEMLYALQQRDIRGQKIDPVAVRQAVSHLAERVESIATAAAGQLPSGTQANVDALVRETRRILRSSFDRFEGVDPTSRDVLDLSELGVRGLRGGTTQRPGGLDVSEIRQPWLRQMLVTFIAETKPNTTEARRGLRVCRAASRALDMRPGGGMDAAALNFADMNAVVDTFRQLPKLDGGAMSSKQRGALLSCFFKVLDYNRAAGHLDGMSASFTRHSSHTVKQEEVNEDDTGKALPESVIDQLDSFAELLGRDISHGKMTPEQVAALARAVYELLRDTGRRPYEIAELRANCLEYADGEWLLIWDNRKGRRLNRRLEITPETVETIRAWLAVRDTLDLPTGSEPFLFPPAGENGIIRHLGSEQISTVIRKWADSVPVLLSEEFGKDGKRVAFDRSLVYPYAFRHSFCQRYADAGVPIEVLRELMDHKSMQTTQRYYKISQKRKREAVNVMRLHTVDRKGQAAPMASATAYEARSVAVPFGNCTEPSNVKAGGKACPIRFQCAACPSYRPDPSYLPAIEEHVRSLKADKEMAVMMEADEFVVKNLDDQISAFKGTAETMRKLVEAMSQDEREEVEQASAVLRKVRAAQGRSAVSLPTPTFPNQRGGSTA